MKVRSLKESDMADFGGNESGRSGNRRGVAWEIEQTGGVARRRGREG